MSAPNAPIKRQKLPELIKKNKKNQLTQEETYNLNRPISIKEIKSVIKILPKQKTSAWMSSPVNSTRLLRKKLYQFSKISFRI